MKLDTGAKALFFILLFFTGVNLYSQGEPEPDAEELPVQPKTKILTGLYVGSYFANKYTASTYNGYGYDVDGNRNSFINSFMYQKIKNEYGGGYGQFDQIAQALGVDQKQWEFNESDMPTNMRYVPAILLGLNFKIPVMKKSAIIFNLSGTKLSVEGNFTMSLLRPPGSTNPAFNTNLLTFPIKGSEQRLLIQLGFQHIFGSDEKLNFFGEIGFHGTLAKYNSNTIYINDLTIDLTYYVNQTINPAPGPTKTPVGFGIGAFAGLGVNMELNPKFTVQILYSPSHEKVNIGTNPTLKLQHGVGLRVYYKI
ncbi:MAG: hypothetical protein V4635_00030 [Bacteroidota bacterium]